MADREPPHGEQGHATDTRPILMHPAIGLTERSRALTWMVSTSFFFGMTALDYRWGKELHLSVGYLIPIFMLTWNVGRSAGMAASAASAVVGTVATMLSGQSHSHVAVPVIEMALRSCFFGASVIILSELKQALTRERDLARIDHLTGVANRRAFVETAEAEIQRARRHRHSLTVAYYDLDDFKSVNDRYGHRAGDTLLKVVASALVAAVRATDVVARLGGDEFGVLLPETPPDAAPRVLAKLREKLLRVLATEQGHITISVGAVTFISPPGSATELIERADALMYAVKSSGKNRLQHAVIAPVEPDESGPDEVA